MHCCCVSSVRAPLHSTHNLTHARTTIHRWSLHPVIGPRLVSGDWVDESALPDLLAGLFRQAQQPVEGFDYRMVMPGLNDKAARRRQQGRRE